MKTRSIHAGLLFAALLVLPCFLAGQSFNAGSNGSYGAINITSGTATTLTTPADGIFHCTTINVAVGQTLTFTRNVLNTPIYLLATGDVTIAGTVNVSASAPLDGTGNTVGGTGGPGGFDGGVSGFVSTGVTRLAGSGRGPGGGSRGTASTAGSGSYATKATTQVTRGHGATYGNALLLPLIGGSGGGGIDFSNGGYGGGGGGAILVGSNTKITVTGTIQANGGGISVYTTGNQGSGGAVRLVAPKVFGAGSIQAGPSNVSPATYNAGKGRIRVDSVFKIDPQDPAQKLALVYDADATTTIGATLIVFPPNNPHIDVIEAAGTAIAEGAAAPVFVLLPFGADPARTIKVQARNFAASVPIRVALIPESGDATFYDDTIDNTTVNPATATVNVTVPINVKVEVQVWTR